MSEADRATDIWIVLKNRDFTEGRGPMLYHKAFNDLPSAELYVAAQPGIMGAEQALDNRRNADNTVQYWNGFEIRKEALLTIDHSELFATLDSELREAAARVEALEGERAALLNGHRE